MRDLGRFSLIVADVKMMPLVLNKLGECPDFDVIRLKTRLDPDHVADETAGYRDCQILVRREPRGRWIVEIQVIPGGIYELKQSCGHSGCTKYRFVLEACRRARMKTAGQKVVTMLQATKTFATAGRSWGARRRRGSCCAPRAHGAATGAGGASGRGGDPCINHQSRRTAQHLNQQKRRAPAGMDTHDATTAWARPRRAPRPHTSATQPRFF